MLFGLQWHYVVSLVETNFSEFSCWASTMGSYSFCCKHSISFHCSNTVSPKQGSLDPILRSLSTCIANAGMIARNKCLTVATLIPTFFRHGCDVSTRASHAQMPTCGGCVITCIPRSGIQITTCIDIIPRDIVSMLHVYTTFRTWRSRKQILISNRPEPEDHL